MLIMLPGIEVLMAPPEVDIATQHQDSTAHFAGGWRSPGTIRGYRSSWRSIVEKCMEVDRSPLPMSVGTAIGRVLYLKFNARSLGAPRLMRIPVWGVAAWELRGRERSNPTGPRAYQVAPARTPRF